MTEITSELAGNAWKVLARVGDIVAAGDVLVILESMKMEIEVRCPVAGAVTQVVEEGTNVATGHVLAIIDAA